MTCSENVPAGPKNPMRNELVLWFEESVLIATEPSWHSLVTAPFMEQKDLYEYASCARLVSSD
ncbi:unannotated protein [freshwater metagenome]|uniref:Unannotated protein n=1 Tax=freshwater metagenome TaxID=449393 RepID=A0A6J7UNN4_9ZZZZ